MNDEVRRYNKGNYANQINGLPLIDMVINFQLNSMEFFVDTTFR